MIPQKSLNFDSSVGEFNQTLQSKDFFLQVNQWTLETWAHSSPHRQYVNDEVLQFNTSPAPFAWHQARFPSMYTLNEHISGIRWSARQKKVVNPRFLQVILESKSPAVLKIMSTMETVAWRLISGGQKSLNTPKKTPISLTRDKQNFWSDQKEIPLIFCGQRSLQNAVHDVWCMKIKNHKSSKLRKERKKTWNPVNGGGCNTSAPFHQWEAQLRQLMFQDNPSPKCLGGRRYVRPSVERKVPLPGPFLCTCPKGKWLKKPLKFWNKKI